ncbi:hypothetical protein JGS09_17865 [Enterobacter cloacae]|nr:hypothetical protein [Enterobacter cloacae]MBJ6498381.1 hypothetical protein [Enterobacter cloacae]
MSELTKEWLLKTIAELEEERDAMPGVVNEDSAMALAAMKLALASLEAEPGVNHQPVAWQYKEYVYVSGLGYLWREKLDCEFPGAECEMLKDVVPLYKAPPAPVSVPAAMEMDDDFDSAFEHGKAVGWNACRAAMLQGAEPVTTAYKLRDAVETIRNSGIEIDAEKIFAERDALNSPVIPDGWVMVPEEPTHEMLEAGDEQFGTYDVYRRMIEAAPKLE